MQQNFLSPTGFRFSIKRLPHVTFFVQSAQVPGISMNSTDQATPFKTIHRGGDKITYNDLTVTIRMDEYMESYNEIADWMIGLTKPESFDQYSALKKSDFGLYSDASLIILDSRQNPGIEITFKDLFPVDLGSITLDATQAGINYATCDITFRTNGHSVHRVKR